MTQETVDKIISLGFEEDETVSLGASIAFGCRFFYCQRREVYLTDYDPFTHQVNKFGLSVLTKDGNKFASVSTDIIGDEQAFNFCIEE